MQDFEKLSLTFKGYLNSSKSKQHEKNNYRFNRWRIDSFHLAVPFMEHVKYPRVLDDLYSKSRKNINPPRS